MSYRVCADGRIEVCADGRPQSCGCLGLAGQSFSVLPTPACGGGDARTSINIPITTTAATFNRAVFFSYNLSAPLRQITQCALLSSTGAARALATPMGIVGDACTSGFSAMSVVWLLSANGAVSLQFTRPSNTTGMAVQFLGETCVHDLPDGILPGVIGTTYNQPATVDCSGGGLPQTTHAVLIGRFLNRVGQSLRVTAHGTHPLFAGNVGVTGLRFNAGAYQAVSSQILFSAPSSNPCSTSAWSNVVTVPIPAGSIDWTAYLNMTPTNAVNGPAAAWSATIDNVELI